MAAQAGLLAAAVLAACGRDAGKPVRSEGSRDDVARAALVAMGSVASAAAFDLVAADDGALIVWAPAGEHGEIRVRSLDALGAPRSPARMLARSEPGFAIVELAAAAVGDRLGVAWSESSQAQARIKAVLVPAGAGAQRSPELLASGPADLAAGRGRIAIAAIAAARMRVLYPAGPADCADSQQQNCIGYAFQELGGESARREPWLSVPQPCPEGATSVAGLDGRFFYAVCSWRGDAPATMAYAINVETYYARADEVLRGCTPLGMLAIDGGNVLLGGECGVLRRAARLTLDMKPAAEFPLADLALECRGERPTLRAVGWELPLDEARAGLAAVLPAAVAPIGARAVWTGRALIVAQRMSGGLELSRHTCDNGVLRTDTSAAARPVPGASAR